MTPEANITREISPLVLRAEISAVNGAQRTFDIVWTTGAKVLRQGWDGPFFEELSLDPKHVRLGRLNNGAPLLNAHGRSYLVTLDDQIGVVEPGSARLDGAKGRARVRFSKRADVQPIVDDVNDKIIVNASVGYRVYRFEKVEGGDAKIPTFRATDWEPYEISPCPMGADDGAGFRSEGGKPNPCLFIRQQETITMDPTTQPATEGADDRTTTPPAGTTASERARAAGILSAVRAARLDMQTAQDMIRDGVPLDRARAQILDTLAARDDATSIIGHIRDFDGRASLDNSEDFRAAAADALVMRSGIQIEKPHAAAADLRGLPALEIARICLSRAGVSVQRLSPSRLIERAMTTGDFPLILGDAMHKSVRQGYESEPSSHRAWVRPQSVVDFRDQKRPILGSAPDLLPLLEAEEYKDGAMDEDSTSYKIAKFGRIITLTWETLVNDNLGAFQRVQPALGQAARRLEADTVYALFALNSGAGPTMQDGVALFHVDHGNIAASGPVDAAALGAARTLLRKQKAVGGGYLALVPRFWIVPPEYETTAEILLAAATRVKTATTEADRPDWIARLELVVEPRLPVGTHYLAADQGQIDTVELGLLEENMAGPIIEQEEEFRRDVANWKVRHVFGAKVLDWRGLVKMPVS